MTFKKTNFAFLFGLALIWTLIEQSLTYWTQLEISNPLGASELVWFYAGLMIVFSFLFPVTISLSCLGLITNQESLFVFLKKNFSSTIKESMRVWGKAILWGFLFIIPGIYKFIQGLFVPFIVCLDSDYSLGKIDALKRSQKLTEGCIFKLFGLLLVFDAVIPLALSSLDTWQIFWLNPLSALAICFVELMLNICFIWILWRKYELIISMERN